MFFERRWRGIAIDILPNYLGIDFKSKMLTVTWGTRRTNA